MINYTFSLVQLEYFIMIMIRVASFVYLAPFFGMSNTPARVKIGLAFATSILLYGTMDTKPLNYNTLIGFGIIVLKEVTTGLLIAFAANICASIITFAGRIIDMEIGLSMATIFDQTTKDQLSITGAYYQQIFMLLLILTGMYQYLLRALAETFILIPIGGAIFNINKLMSSMITFATDFMVIGFRICLPVFAVMLLLNAVLGILAKVAPQMNMFAVGMQLKVLVGLCVLFVTTALLPSIADFIFIEMKTMIVSVVEAML